MKSGSGPPSRPTLPFTVPAAGASETNRPQCGFSCRRVKKHDHLDQRQPGSPVRPRSGLSSSSCSSDRPTDVRDHHPAEHAHEVDADDRADRVDANPLPQPGEVAEVAIGFGGGGRSTPLNRAEPAATVMSKGQNRRNPEESPWTTSTVTRTRVAMPAISTSQTRTVTAVQNSSLTLLGGRSAGSETST